MASTIAPPQPLRYFEDEDREAVVRMTRNGSVSGYDIKLQIVLASDNSIFLEKDTETVDSGSASTKALVKFRISPDLDGLIPEIGYLWYVVNKTEGFRRVMAHGPLEIINRVDEVV